jgi:hypothetical protein
MTDPQLLVEFLRRSYHAVDGLWFLQAEEALGFDRALELDGRVWAVLAKLQARKARELLQVTGHSLPELVRCFSLKLTADDFQFETQVSETEACFLLHHCPWRALLQRAGREHLAARIAEVMCRCEGEAWAREFGDTYIFTAPTLACCEGGARCAWVFSRKGEAAPA